MNKRTIVPIAIAAAAALALGVTGCSSSDKGNGDAGGDVKTTVLRVAFNQDANHPQAKAITALSEKLEEQTGGKYALELFPDGTLGAQEATIEQVQSGTIDLALVAGPLLESFSSDFSVVNLPYIYDSPEHQVEALNDDAVTGELYETLKEDNIQVLAAFHAGVRNVYASEPVTTPADLAGKKIRVIGSPTNVRLMELMGGVGTPMAQDEVYTAIQSGVLDGAENAELIYGSMSALRGIAGLLVHEAPHDARLPRREPGHLGEHGCGFAQGLRGAPARGARRGTHLVRHRRRRGKEARRGGWGDLR